MLVWFDIGDKLAPLDGSLRSTSPNSIAVGGAELSGIVHCARCLCDSGLMNRLLVRG